MEKETFLTIAHDFLCELDSYVSMEYEPYGNGRKYISIDHDALIKDFDEFINKRVAGTMTH